MARLRLRGYSCMSVNSTKKYTTPHSKCYQTTRNDKTRKWTLRRYTHSHREKVRAICRRISNAVKSGSNMAVCQPHVYSEVFYSRRDEETRGGLPVSSRPVSRMLSSFFRLHLSHSIASALRRRSIEQRRKNRSRRRRRGPRWRHNDATGGGVDVVVAVEEERRRGDDGDDDDVGGSSAHNNRTSKRGRKPTIEYAEWSAVYAKWHSKID